LDNCKLSSVQSGIANAAQPSLVSPFRESKDKTNNLSLVAVPIAIGTKDKTIYFQTNVIV